MVLHSDLTLVSARKSPACGGFEDSPARAGAERAAQIHKFLEFEHPREGAAQAFTCWGWPAVLDCVHGRVERVRGVLWNRAT